METKWIIIAVLAICAVALVIYLIIRNQKDEKEFIKHLNETEMDEELEQNERGEI